ncbi:MAG: FecR family protein, partial [Candidatus Omnitrophota bacterium]|nr:FecR family protein [Candidatus Omnitrophota bacterium]
MKRIGILTLCMLFVLSCSAMAMAAEIGKVTAAEGRVDVTRAPDNEAILLPEGAPVFVGDAVRTKDHSKVEIVFADKSVVKIAPNTHMEIKDFAVKGSTRERAEIYISRGKILADVSKTGSPDTFIITTPNAKGSVRGTEVIVFYQAERTNALVKDGRLSIYNIALPEQKKEITGGEEILIPFDAAPEKPRPYMDAEFELHKQDTKPVVFRAVSLGKDAAVMRGTITTLMGGVRILKKGGTDWHYVKLNEFVGEGDKIEAAEDGRMSLQFDNGNIIQIQPNSRITLSTLRRDPKTKEFDNTFDMDTGKLKAVVEKLGTKSSFRVKTPTALCGVRGTIMYLEVSLASTQAFYEGGGGVVTNTISGDTQFMESGQNAMSTSAGTISVPVVTSTEQKMTCEATYEYGVAKGEYAAPENGAVDTKGGDTTVSGMANNSDTKTQTGGTNGTGTTIPAELVPITEVTPPPVKPVTPPTSKVSFSGLVGRVNGTGAIANTCTFSPEDPTNSVTGKFTFSVSTNSVWTTAGQGSITGNVSRSNYIPSSYAFWISDQAALTTASGGQYRGWLGASLSRSSSSSATTLWSKALCLYRDPYGYIGTLTFNAGGKYDPSANYFNSELSTSSDVVFTQREFVGSTYNLNAQTLETENIYARGRGYFSGTTGIQTGGTIACGTDANGSRKGLSGITFNLPLTDWGIWQIQAQGDYISSTSQPTTNSWTLALGGERGTLGSWLGVIDGNLWDDRDVSETGVNTNQITGEFKGVFF